MQALRISTDRDARDIDMVHRFLSQEAYWSRGIPRATVEQAVAGSLCFAAPARPQTLMEVQRPDIYQTTETAA